MDTQLTIGQAIRKVRGATKLRDLSAATGFSIGYLSDVQTDRTMPSIKALLVIGRALGVRPGLILDMATDPGVFDRETFCRNVLKMYDAFSVDADRDPVVGRSPFADMRKEPT